MNKRNRRHQQFPFGPAYSSGGLQGRNLEHENNFPQNSRNFYTVLAESRSKENLAKTVFKIYEKEFSQFAGIDSRLWAIHLQTFVELAETHEVRNPETLLQLIRWTLGPGPKMVLDKFKSEPNHT